MKIQIVVACCAVFLCQNLASGFFWQGTRKPGSSQANAKGTKAKNENPAFSLAEMEYFERFSNASRDLFEFTPADQTDLDRYTDMVTINYYRKTSDSDALAAVANSVLQNYQANKARILGTKSVPRTKEKPAEHLIVVIFSRPDFTEASFTRFRMHDGMGTSIVYSRRAYGGNAREEVSAWLKTNGPETEKTLMQWDEMPPTPATE